MTRDLIRRYCVFLSLNVVTPIFLALSVYIVLSSIFEEQQDDLLSKRLTVEKMRNIAAGEKEMLQTVHALQQADVSIGFLKGSDHASLDAGLQSDLRTTVSTQAAKFQAVRALPDQIKDDITYIGARLEFSGNLAAIQAVIYGIETRKPLSIITAASLKSARNFGVSNDIAEPELDVFLDVYRPLAPSFEK